MASRLLFVAGGALVQQRHDLGLGLQGLHQEAAGLLHRHALEQLGQKLGLRGLVFAGQVDVAQALQDRLGGVDGVVLRDQQGAAERWFAGVVAVVLHPGGADAAAVVGGLELVPVEVLHRRAFLLLALGLDQHDRQVADLGEVARAAGGVALDGSKPSYSVRPVSFQQSSTSVVLPEPASPISSRNR